MFGLTDGRVNIGKPPEGVSVQDAIAALTDAELAMLTSELSHECEQQVNGDVAG